DGHGGWKRSYHASGLEGIVELTAGTHTVELRYYPQGLHEGLLISGGALFVLAVIVASMYIRKKKQGKTSAKMRRTVEKEPDGDLKLRN
ncbi:MAG: hypothetical protein ACLS5Z_10525, partial [Clostridium fessum]